jgi:signal peptidase complex subunit 2
MADQSDDETEKEIKVDKWDTSAVRNAIEDATKKFFNDQDEFTEDFKLFDTKLALCTIACLFSGFALIYDYFIAPFPKSTNVLMMCSISYFVTMGVVTLFSMFVEKNCFFRSKERREGGIGTPSMWTIESKFPKYTDKFVLLFIRDDSQTGQRREEKLEKSISSWFDKKGVLDVDRLNADLATMQKNVKTKKTN